MPDKEYSNAIDRYYYENLRISHQIDHDKMEISLVSGLANDGNYQATYEKLIYLKRDLQSQIRNKKFNVEILKSLTTHLVDTFA